MCADKCAVSKRCDMRRESRIENAGPAQENRQQKTVHLDISEYYNIHCAKYHEVTYASNKDTIDKEEIIKEACER